MRNTGVEFSNFDIYTGILKKIRYFLARNKLGELLVMQGVISPYELRSALARQNEASIPLGQVFIDLGYLTKKQLCFMLFKQKALRFAASGLLFIVCVCSFIKTTRADRFDDKLVLASVSAQNFENMSVYPALFGANETRSDNLKAFTKWLGMFERFDRELTKTGARRTMKAMKKELSRYSSGSIFEMAEQVDAMMNKKKYIIDQKNWGKSDYWATPVEFMKHGGDCEDFAIAKYVALRLLGVPESRMRIAIVQDLNKNIPHAVLVVYANEGTFVLDNQSEIMKEVGDIAHYKPIFSINRQSWWLHTTPDNASNTIVASAK